MKNRKLLLIGSLILALVVSLSGTLAYLTDTDTAVNVMTLGNVDIEQHELQRKDGVAYNATAGEGDLEEFEQGQPLYPAYPHNNAATDYSAELNDLFGWGPYVTADNPTGAAANGLWNEDKLTGAMDKFVFVENTGTSAAYYRTLIAFECPEGMEYSAGSDKEFMMNVNSHSLFDWETIGYIEVNGMRYLVEAATYQAELEPGTTSRPSLLQVVMTHNATSEDMDLLGDTYEILVLTQACQTVNMPADANQALDIAFGDVTTESAANWFGGVSVPVVVSTLEELTAAVGEGKDVLLSADVQVQSGEVQIPAGAAFDGGSNTVAVTSGITTKPILGTTGGTIRNVTVIGQGKSVQGIGAGMTEANPLTEDLVLENVTVDDVMYAVIGTANNVKVQANNCTLYGAFSYPGASKVELTGCTLGAGKSMYDFFEVAGDTSFVNCAFEDSYCFLAYDTAAGKTVTFTNCTVNGEKLTAANFKALLIDDRWDYSSELSSENLKDCTIMVDGVAVTW